MGTKHKRIELSSWRIPLEVAGWLTSLVMRTSAEQTTSGIDRSCFILIAYLLVLVFGNIDHSYLVALTPSEFFTQHFLLGKLTGFHGAW